MQDGLPAGFPSCTCIRNPTKKRNMNHTDFYARIRAIKEMEYRELYAAIELHGASYEWNEGVS